MKRWFLIEGGRAGDCPFGQMSKCPLEQPRRRIQLLNILALRMTVPQRQASLAWCKHRHSN